MQFQKSLWIGVLFFSLRANLSAQEADRVVVRYDPDKRQQTIANFGASDAWAAQFVGNWPESKKNQIADWLFSTDTLANGNPKGIGLSLWRYNLGAGSAEQGEASGIRDEWRRAALTTGGGPQVQAQNWFLQAAKKRGVQQFLAFFNSPPVSLTRNGKAYAVKGVGNIDSSRFTDFAGYAVRALQAIHATTAVRFDYLSPVNEPQWDWSDGGQEGSPYTNAQISGLVKAFHAAFRQNGLPTKLLVSEAGHLKYLLDEDDKPGKGRQLRSFFDPASPAYIGHLPSVARCLAAHSYFSTSPLSRGLALRERIRDSIARFKDLQLWQSEYCILGDNEKEIDGRKKDLGMTAALYLAKVIWQDLTVANASAWQWWTALSAYDYKDGLVYVDKHKEDGRFSDSKLLWVLGNYSRFVRPGMTRMESTVSGTGLLVSAFRDRKKQVLVLVNESNENKQVGLQKKSRPLPANQLLQTFTTNETGNLHKAVVVAGAFSVPPRSVVTVVLR